MRTAKTLIRLGGCPGWSESSLGAHAILLFFSWGGSYYADLFLLLIIQTMRTIFAMTTTAGVPAGAMWAYDGGIVNNHCTDHFKLRSWLGIWNWIKYCKSRYFCVFFISWFCDCKWALSWENVSSGVSDQVRLKLACSATEASRRLEILVTETRDITLSRQWTTKALIRLRGGWSAPLLFAYDIRHVFSWPSSNVFAEI